MRVIPLFIGACVLSLSARAEPLKVNVSGESREKVELETLSPKPDIPSAAELPFSSDGGKDAIEKELSPLAVSEAAKLTDPTRLPPPSLPFIPDAPFIVQAVPGDQPPDAAWEFFVVDERNHLWHKQSGQGAPPRELVWDGRDGGPFVLDPNRAYFSMFVSSSPARGVVSAAGEATRFIAFCHQEEGDSLVTFGERVYKEGEATFSEEGKLTLRDLSRRLSRMKREGPGDGQTWDVVLSEPLRADNPFLAANRRKTWEVFLERELGTKIGERRVTLRAPEAAGAESTVTVTLRGQKPLAVDAAMRGAAEFGRPAMEPMGRLISIRQGKDAFVIELRHDKLFRPGTAYLRDEALPYLTQALSRLPKGKKVLLRSYTERPRDEKKRKEEDPRLAAMRTKVLFSLFAEKGFLPTF